MPKNGVPAALAGRWLALSLLVALVAGCRGRRVEEGFQGVVEYEERDLAFEVTGRITSLDVHEGDRLTAGTLIARLAPELERSTLSVRESEARAAEAQLSLVRAGTRPEDVRALMARVDAARASESLLRTNAERARKLFAAQATPRAALDEAEAQLLRAAADRRAAEESVRAAQRGARAQEIRSAEDRVSAARASSDVQRERLARYDLRALDPGEVLEVHLRPGELAVAGVPVVTVADTDHPYADVFVAQGAVGGIHVGTPAEARIDARPRPFPGRVERISRRTEFTPRYLFSPGERENLMVRVRVRFDDPEHALVAGVPMFVRIARGDRAPEGAPGSGR
jgi:multidrug resistance efflux pump